MASHYTWTVILIAVVCGGPVVAGLFLAGGDRRCPHCSWFPGVASLAGIWPLSVYLTWHGQQYGWRGAEIQGFSETVLFLSVASPLLHGVFALWLSRRFAAVAQPSFERPRNRRSRKRIKSWLLDRAPGFGSLCGVLFGIWLGWLVSDGLGYPGGLSAMLFPEEIAPGAVVMEGVERCCGQFPSDETELNALPAGRFLVLLVSTLLLSCFGRALARIAGRRRIRNDGRSREAGP